VLSFGVEFLLRLPDRPPIHTVYRVELLVGEGPSSHPPHRCSQIQLFSTF
jgi:hypothetical protein